MYEQELYRQEILEHYRHPQNFGRLKKSSYQSYMVNPLCGDEMDLQLRMERGQVKNVKFMGRGCALSIASASLFTEQLKGKSLAQLKKLTARSVLKNLGVPIGPARRKCALLVSDALQEIINTSKK